jgi:ribosome modulation factor
MAPRSRRRTAPSTARAGRASARNGEAAATDAGGPPPLALTNVPDATLRKHLRECHRRKTEIERVTGEYRSAVKAAKADGIDPADVAWYVRTRKRDSADIDAELRRRARIAAALELDILLQAALFPDEAARTSARPAPSGGRRFPAGSRKALTQAAAQGHAAGDSGASKEACPYPGGTPEAVKWLASWAEAQTGIVSRMGRGDDDEEDREGASA